LEVKLTHTVSHPALWHRIDPASSSLALSPHKHRDRPLISLHFHLRPTRVGSDSKNKVVDWSVTGMGVDNELVGILEPPDWCTIEVSAWCVGGGTRDCCISKVASSLDNACIAHSKNISACRTSLQQYITHCYCPSYYLLWLRLQYPSQYHHRRICPMLSPRNCCHWHHLRQKTLTQMPSLSHYSIPLVLVSFCMRIKKMYFSMRRERCVSEITRRCCVFECAFGCSCRWSQMRFIPSFSSFESIKIESWFFKETAGWCRSRWWWKL